ncbi:MAG: hypothetical protein WDZ39_00795, partial [Candidatus Spechtbacterales bacterium]
NKNKKEEGAALYFAVLATTAILAIATGMLTILIGELRIARDIGNFVPAIYAADSGVEEALYTIRWTTEFQSGTSTPVSECTDSSSCRVDSDKCGPGQNEECMENDGIYRGYVLEGGVNPIGAPECDGNLNACIFITGTFGDTNRAFEVGF